MKKLPLLVFFVLFVVLPSPAFSDDISFSSAPRGGDLPECGDGGGGGGGGFHLNPLRVEGDEIISIGSQYAAEGGLVPYKWSLSAGFIDNTGRVTELVECSDTVQVKVVDAMGIQASKVTTRGTSPLDVAGTEIPIADSQYSASGGTESYAWSISCGTIDSSGRVGSVAGCCGSGSVTVTDSCGQLAQKTVRFPGGQWVTISDEKAAGYSGSADQYRSYLGGECNDPSWGRSLKDHGWPGSAANYPSALTQTNGKYQTVAHGGWWLKTDRECGSEQERTIPSYVDEKFLGPAPYKGAGYGGAVNRVKFSCSYGCATTYVSYDDFVIGVARLVTREWQCP